VIYIGDKAKYVGIDGANGIRKGRFTTISVALTRKKKTAVDAIRNVAEGKFG
jgi:hypothetical protein